MANNNSLKVKYEKEVKEKLMKELGIKNPMAIPKLEKIVINSGLGEAKNSSDLIDEMVEEMGLIAGQKPVVTKAKKAISNFKIRAGMPIGVKVTLRKERMWYFLDKLINIVLPRVKDFRGITDKSFDGNGNYAFGMNDHTVFPEIDSTKNIKLKPMQIIVKTSTDVDEEARILLKLLGFPFIKK